MERDSSQSRSENSRNGSPPGCNSSCSGDKQPALGSHISKPKGKRGRKRKNLLPQDDDDSDEDDESNLPTHARKKRKTKPKKAKRKSKAANEGATPNQPAPQPAAPPMQLPPSHIPPGFTLTPAFPYAFLPSSWDTYTSSPGPLFYIDQPSLAVCLLVSAV